MARMQCKRRGIHCSTNPSKKYPESFVTKTKSEVIDQIVQLARKGYWPSMIGNILRDLHLVPKAEWVTGSKIMRVLKAKGIAPELPEDLFHLIKNAVNIRNHLAGNKMDINGKFRLILTESRIHRLVRYQRSVKKLPSNWKYTPANANALIS